MTDLPCHYKMFAPLHNDPAVVLVHVPDHPHGEHQYLCYQHLWKLDWEHDILMDRRRDYPLLKGRENGTPNNQS